MKNALVVLSGGQDSVTCLGVALHQVKQGFFEQVYAIGFSYGQKHSIELEQAELICEQLGVDFVVHEIPSLEVLADSALTTNGDVTRQHHRDASLPASFVPNRNALFLTIAHAYAQKIGASGVFTGVCQTDYSGYPDCRAQFIEALQTTLNLGYNTDIELVTPLMYLTKAETFHLAKMVGVLDTVITHSHTCYNGNRETFNAWGYGCGECAACELRAKGYNEFLEKTLDGGY